MKDKTEANVYNPFAEFVQQVGVKRLEDVSPIVEDEMNVDVIRKFELNRSIYNYIKYHFLYQQFTS